MQPEIKYRIHVWDGPPAYMEYDWLNPRENAQNILEDTYDWDIESTQAQRDALINKPVYLGELFGWSDFSISSEINRLEGSAKIEINPNQTHVIRRTTNWVLSDGRGNIVTTDPVGTKLLLEQTSYASEINWADQAVDEGYFIQIETYGHPKLSNGERHIIFHGVISDWKMSGDSENVTLNVLSLGGLARNELAVDMFFPEWLPDIRATGINNNKTGAVTELTKYDKYTFLGSAESARVTRIMEWLIVNNRYLNFDNLIWTDAENNIDYTFGNLDSELNSLFYGFELNDQTVGDILDDISNILPFNYYFFVDYSTPLLALDFVRKPYQPVFRLRRNQLLTETSKDIRPAKSVSRQSVSRDFLRPDYRLTSGKEVVNYDITYAGEGKTTRWVVAAEAFGNLEVTNLPAPTPFKSITKETTHPIQVRHSFRETKEEYDLPPSPLTAEDLAEIEKDKQERLATGVTAPEGEQEAIIARMRPKALSYLIPEKRTKLQRILDITDRSSRLLALEDWSEADVVIDKTAANWQRDVNNYLATRLRQGQRALIERVIVVGPRLTLAWAESQVNFDRKNYIDYFVGKVKNQVEEQDRWVMDEVVAAALNKALERHEARKGGSNLPPIDVGDAVSQILTERKLASIPQQKGTRMVMDQEDRYIPRVVASSPDPQLFDFYAYLSDQTTPALQRSDKAQYDSNLALLAVLRQQLQEYLYPIVFNKNRRGIVQKYRTTKMSEESLPSLDAQYEDQREAPRQAVEEAVTKIANEKVNLTRHAQYAGKVLVQNTTDRPLPSYQLGDVIGFTGFNNVVDNVIARISAIKFNRYTAELTLSYVLPSVSRELQASRRDRGNRQRLN